MAVTRETPKTQEHAPDMSALEKIKEFAVETPVGTVKSVLAGLSLGGMLSGGVGMMISSGAPDTMAKAGALLLAGMAIGAPLLARNRQQ
jgi:hypothetical protein